MAMSDLQRYPLKPLSDQNVGDTVVLPTGKDKTLILIISPLLLMCKNCANHFRREPANKNKQF